MDIAWREESSWGASVAGKFASELASADSSGFAWEGPEFEGGLSASEALGLEGPVALALCEHPGLVGIGESGGGVMSGPQFDAKSQTLLGNHAIEASAGTGKTYAITLLWLRLLIEEGMPIDGILVSTFTKAATAELSERLLATPAEARQILGDLRAGEAVSGVAAVMSKALEVNPDRPLERELISWESSFDGRTSRRYTVFAKPSSAATAWNWAATPIWN